MARDDEDREEVHIGRGARVRIGHLAIGMEWVVAVVAILVVGALAALIVVFALGRGDGTAAGGTRPTSAIPEVPTLTPAPTPTPTPVPFTTSAFKVTAGSVYKVPIDLPAGARVEYRYSADLDLDFRVTDPQGNAVRRASRSLGDEGNFVADRLGRYTLEFDNTFSLFAGKNVSLTYRAVPPGGR
jgi:hypothetical protein